MTPPHPHPPVTYVDGRIGWPSVVEYQLYDGKNTRLPVPPSDGSKFLVVIHDIDVYGANARAGVFTDRRHSGVIGTIIDRVGDPASEKSS